MCFRRFLTAIPTLFVIVTIAFFLMRVAPGGPFNQEKGLNPVIKANLERVFHLDEPLWKQYLLYLQNLLQGDFGPSYNLPDFTVADLFAAGLPVSIQLGAMALVLALIIGSTLGRLGGPQPEPARPTMPWWPRQRPEAPFRLLSSRRCSSLFFALTLHWFPVGGWGDGALVNKVGPVLTLMLPQLAIVARLMRGSMIESLHAHHIRTARALGFPIFQLS